jgi:hypothetical protein
LATLRQHGLCVVNPEGFIFYAEDTHEDLENKFRELFPPLFQWLDDTMSDFLDLSRWMICSKRCNHRKGVMVNSDDRKLPDGGDIIAACQGGPGKVNFLDLTLFLGMHSFLSSLTLIQFNIFYSY